MIQVWFIDSQGFYQNRSDLVEEVTENTTTVPLLIGYIKPQLVNGEWVEGATEEEIKEWEDSQHYYPPTPLPPRNLEQELNRAEERIARLEEQVRASNEQQEFYENCIIEMAELVYA